MGRSAHARAAAISLLASAALLVSGCKETPPAPAAPPADPLASARASALAAVCAPTGAHAGHAAIACGTCHLGGGPLCFDPAGPAVTAGQTLPGFDATAKTCSSVACHGMYAGTFTYEGWDWGCDCPVENSVSYVGAGGNTPSWYSTGAGCSACHGNPPRNYPWHINHSNGTIPGGQDCQLCHPDALSVTGTGVGYALNTATTCTVNGVPKQSCALLHANRSIDLAPKFSSRCFNCH